MKTSIEIVLLGFALYGMASLVKKTLKEGEEIPRGYGIAWFDWPSEKYLAYPLPLNLIIRYIRKIYYKMVCLKTDNFAFKTMKKNLKKHQAKGQKKNEEEDIETYSKIFLGGKSLEELNFPDGWEYDPAKCRWKSEKHYMLVRHGTSKKETGSPWGRPHKQYLYITNEMLANLKRRLRADKQKNMKNGRATKGLSQKKSNRSRTGARKGGYLIKKIKKIIS